MACECLTNIPYSLGGLCLSCKESSFGGIKRIGIIDRGDVTKVTVTANTDGDNWISAIEVADSKEFSVYTLLKSTCSMTSTLNTSENTASYWTTELALQFMKMESKKRTQIMAALMTPSAIIVEDANSKYWYLGKDNYVEGTAGSANTGTAASDNNLYEITLSDTSLEAPFEIDPTVGAGLLD